MYPSYLWSHSASKWVVNERFTEEKERKGLMSHSCGDMISWLVSKITVVLSRAVKCVYFLNIMLCLELSEWIRLLLGFLPEGFRWPNISHTNFLIWLLQSQKFQAVWNTVTTSENFLQVSLHTSQTGSINLWVKLIICMARLIQLKKIPIHLKVVVSMA